MHSKLGKSLFIDITYEITINTLGEESEIPCSTEMDYAFDDCMSQEVVDKLVSRHGCSLPYLPSDGNSPICDPTNVELREAAFKDYDFFTSNGQKQLCDRPCSTMEVFSGLPVDGVTENGLAQMKMYLKSTTKIKRMVLDYTIISMIAEIGGYTGLLLGISFVNITRVLDRLFARCLHKS